MRNQLPKIDQADSAAQRAYDSARRMGMNDEEAHNISRDAWSKQMEPPVMVKGGEEGLDVYGKTGAEGSRGNTVPLPPPPQCPAPPCGGPTGTVGIGPPSPMSKSIGGMTNLGNVLKGGS
jgi:hypothetical protein